MIMDGLESGSQAPNQLESQFGSTILDTLLVQSFLLQTAQSKSLNWHK